MKLVIEKEIATISRELVLYRDRTSKLLFKNSDLLTPAPQPPSSLTVSDLSETQVDLSWTAPSFGNFDSYTIYVYDGEVLEQKIENIVGTSTTVFGLTEGTEYEFWVVSVRNNIESAESNHVTAIPADIVSPDVPTGLQATPGDAEVILDWNDNSEPDLAGYNVYVDGVADTNNPYLTSEATITGLTNGVEYDFQVSAFDENDNESDKTPIVSSTPAPLQPDAPANLVVTQEEVSANTHSLSFDGVNDVVLIPYREFGGNLTSCTIEFAFKSNASASSILLGTVNDGSNSIIRIFINKDEDLIDAPGKMCIQIRDNSANQRRIGFTNDESINNNEWHHFALILDGLTWKVYIDKVEVDLTLSSVQNNTSNFGTFDYDIAFGADNARGSIGSNSEVLADDLRLWTDVRTEQEIIDNADIELVGDEAGLGLYYKFNEGSGSTAEDATANNNDGTINGAVYQTDVPFGIDQTNANFTWDAVPDVDGYNLYLNTDGAGYVKHNTSLITDLEYTIENLDAGSYEAYVTAEANGEESDPSNVVEFSIEAPLEGGWFHSGNTNGLPIVDLWEPNRLMYVAVDDSGDIYLGMGNDGSFHQELHVFDGTSWSEITTDNFVTNTLRTPNGVNAFWRNNRFYYLGQGDSFDLPDIRYKPSTDWNTVTEYDYDYPPGWLAKSVYDSENDLLYYGGGREGSSFMATLYVIDMATGTRTQLSSPSVGSTHSFYGGNFLLLNGYLYAITWNNSSENSELWRYTIGTDSWAQLVDVPENMGNLSYLWHYDGGIYVFGNAGNSGNVSVIYRYDIALNSWELWDNQQEQEVGIYVNSGGTYWYDYENSRLWIFGGIDRTNTIFPIDNVIVYQQNEKNVV